MVLILKPNVFERVSRLPGWFGAGSIVMGAMCFGVPGLAQGYLAGDIDGDGAVTQTDIGLLNGYLQGAHALTNQQISAADVDRDGQITTADLDQLQRNVQVAVQVPNSSVTFDSAYSGQIVDRQTGQPLGGVEVAIPGAGISVQTDSQGRFQLPENVPSDQILTARLENYLPYSQTTTGEGQPLQLELDRWDQDQTLVLESNVVRLGDNFYSSQSAAAGEFQLPAEGRELIRSFELDQKPNRLPTLRIGSLIGLDTPEAYRAGQGQVYGDMSPLEVLLNGQQVRTIATAGDNLAVPLPLQYLQVGTNTVLLRTGKTHHGQRPGQRGGAQIPVNIPLFGGNLRMNVPVGTNRGGMVDYDDIQLANVVVDLP